MNADFSHFTHMVTIKIVVKIVDKVDNSVYNPHKS